MNYPTSRCALPRTGFRCQTGQSQTSNLVGALIEPESMLNISGHNSEAQLKLNKIHGKEFGEASKGHKATRAEMSCP